MLKLRVLSAQFLNEKEQLGARTPESGWQGEEDTRKSKGGPLGTVFDLVTPI